MLPGTFILFLIYATVTETKVWIQDADNRNKSGFGEITDEINKDTLRNKEDDDANNGPLLVGFGGDPFKYSIPEEDYLKGFKNITHGIRHTNNTENRSKRGLIQLFNIVDCGTDCNMMDYTNYGCYCGAARGFGEAVDEIDECCKEHKSCYDNLEDPIITRYYWHCFSDGPECSWKNDALASRVCKCDEQFSLCLKDLDCPRENNECFCSPFCWLGKDYWSKHGYPYL